MEKIDISKHSEQSYLDYAIAVLKNRAVPYLQDGQKPVHRRILYVMHELGLKNIGSPKKSARIVGDIIGKYHPHGDSAVYEAMVKMSQDFYLRYPLVNGQGNFGSRDGDSAAAMRYTEAKLTPISELLLSDLKYDCFNMQGNYDNTLKEPELLPSRLNFLLMNGTFGIAIGLQTDIPSHNIQDVTNATLKYIENNNVSVDELAETLNAPDLATGGQIITPRSNLIEAYKTGNGTFTIRCRWHSEKQGRNQYKIIVTELPPGTSVEKVLQKIDNIENPKTPKEKNGKQKKPNSKALANKQYIQSLISNAENDSDKDNLRLVLEPKNSKMKPDELMERLYKILDLEENLKIDMTTVGNDMLPRRKNLKEIIAEWFDYRFLTVTRRIESLLVKAEARIHILEGRKIAFDHIDEVINIIKNEDEPEIELINKFKLSEMQAKDILEIRLRQLVKLEVNKIIKELDSLNKDRNKYTSLLGSKVKMTNFIKKEIIADTEKFADERRTLVEEAERSVVRKEDTILEEKITIIINKNGWITQRKGHDFDISNIQLRDNSPVDKVIETTNTESIVVLNDQGRIFNFKTFDVPSGKNFIHINSLIDNSGNVVFYSDIKNESIFFASDLGYGFLTKGTSLITKNKAGKQFIDCENGKPFKPIYTGENNLISCLSNDNRLLTYDLSEVKSLKNGGKGVQLIKLNDNVKLDSFYLHNENTVKIRNKKVDTTEFKNKRARKGKSLK